MFGIIEKMFLVLLASIINASNHIKCVYVSNQKNEIQLLILIYILINTVKNFFSIIHLLLK